MKKHAIIIGGTKGTGKVLAEGFYKDGYNVSIIGRTIPKDSAPQINYFINDVTNKEELLSMLKNVISKSGPVNSLLFSQRYRGGNDKFEGEMQTSVYATYNIIEGLIPDFNSSGEKSIIIINSLANCLIVDQPVGYHVAKSALLQMARFYAVKLGKEGIRVNCITPGAILKEESRDFYAKSGIEKKLLKAIPLQRMCAPEDIYNAASFLCSEKASFITGQNIILDGGSSLLQQETLVKNL